MNLFIKFFRYVFLTIIILPLWFINCLAGFFMNILLHYLFSNKLNIKKKYRNNMEKMIIDFINNFSSIFYYY